MPPLRRACGITLCLPACAFAPGRPRAASHQDDGRWGERVVAEAQVLPMRLELDADGPAAAAVGDDSADGVGYGARVAVGNRTQSIGVLYQGFDLATDTADVGLQSALLDFDVRMPLAEGGGALAAVAGAGVGVAWLDLERPGDDVSTEGAAQLRLGLSITPTERFAIDLGVGGSLYGHPGDTAAYGGFLLLGAALSF